MMKSSKNKKHGVKGVLHNAAKDQYILNLWQYAGEKLNLAD